VGVLQWPPHNRRISMTSRQGEQSVALMRVDPFRDLDGFAGDDLDADRLTADARAGVLTLTIPVSEAGKLRWAVLSSADRASTFPNFLAWSCAYPAHAQMAAAAVIEPAPV